MGGGKEDLIDRTQVLTVCARANSSRVWRAENICRHRPLGAHSQLQSPRAQPPAEGASRPSPAWPAAARATAGIGWAGERPTGLRLGGWAQPTPAHHTRPLSPLKRRHAITSQNPPVDMRQHPHAIAQRAFGASQRWGSPKRYEDIKKTLARRAFPEHDSTFNK